MAPQLDSAAKVMRRVKVLLCGLILLDAFGVTPAAAQFGFYYYPQPQHRRAYRPRRKAPAAKPKPDTPKPETPKPETRAPRERKYLLPQPQVPQTPVPHFDRPQTEPPRPKRRPSSPGDRPAAAEPKQAVPSGPAPHVAPPAPKVTAPAARTQPTKPAPPSRPAEAPGPSGAPAAPSSGRPAAPPRVSAPAAPNGSPPGRAKPVAPAAPETPKPEPPNPEPPKPEPPKPEPPKPQAGKPVMGPNPPPLPPVKPPGLSRPPATGVAPSGAKLGETPRQPEDDASCPSRLLARKVMVEPTTIGPQKDDRCTVVQAVRLSSLTLPDGGKIDFPEHPTIACTTADSFSTFVRDLLSPLAKGTLGAPVSAVWTGPGLECRSMDHIVGAKLSAHGQGLAIDIAQVKLADGRMIEVGQAKGDIEQSFETAARTAACGYFHTVLGPGTDSYHRTHWHFDLLVRGAQGDSKYCR